MLKVGHQDDRSLPLGQGVNRSHQVLIHVLPVRFPRRRQWNIRQGRGQLLTFPGDLDRTASRHPTNPPAKCIPSPQLAKFFVCEEKNVLCHIFRDVVVSQNRPRDRADRPLVTDHQLGIRLRVSRQNFRNELSIGLLIQKRLLTRTSLGYLEKLIF